MPAAVSKPQCKNTNGEKQVEDKSDIGNPTNRYYNIPASGTNITTNEMMKAIAHHEQLLPSVGPTTCWATILAGASSFTWFKDVIKILGFFYGEVAEISELPPSICPFTFGAV